MSSTTADERRSAPTMSSSCAALLLQALTRGTFNVVNMLGASRRPRRSKPPSQWQHLWDRASPSQAQPHRARPVLVSACWCAYGAAAAPRTLGCTRRCRNALGQLRQSGSARTGSRRVHCTSRSAWRHVVRWRGAPKPHVLARREDDCRFGHAIRLTVNRKHPSRFCYP